MTERERLFAVLKLQYSDQILLKIDRMEGVIILFEGLEIARFEEFRISALSVCYSYDCNERGLWFIGNSDSELFFFDAKNLSVEMHSFFQRRVLDDEKGLCINEFLAYQGNMVFVFEGGVLSISPRRKLLWKVSYDHTHFNTFSVEGKTIRFMTDIYEGMSWSVELDSGQLHSISGGHP